MDLVRQYRRGIEALFQQWTAKEPAGGINHKTDGFIRDGIVCPEQWFSQGVRPLFLLKEAYGTGDWDLVADHLLIHGMIRSATWRRVSQWTRGLLNTTKTELCPFVQEDAFRFYGNPYLRSMAVVNVRKSGGRTRSNPDVIRRYALYDRAELRQELQLIDPTVIVCGYTISALNRILDRPVTDGKPAQKQNTNLFYHITLNGHVVTVLDYWHPSNRFPDLLNYYGLMGIYQQALLHQARQETGPDKGEWPQRTSS